MTYSAADGENENTRRAYTCLDNYIKAGKLEGMNLFKVLRENVITPSVVYTSDMTFTAGRNKHDLPMYYAKMDSGGSARYINLHKHALGQMAGEVGIPVTFVNTLTKGEDWERQELSGLLEERFKKLDFKQRGGGSPRFINLVVGSELRGFVSRSFKRYLKSGPIFEAFVKACGSFDAMPVEAITSDLMFTLRCVLPYVFELARGKFIAIGVSCSNSDFGAGVFKIGLTVMNLQTGTITYLTSLKEERHVGAAERDGGQSTVLSDETIRKMIIATQAEVRDVVASALHPDRVNALLQTIRVSLDKEISWQRFVNYMQGKLTSDELRELETILKDAKKSHEIADIQYDVDDNAILNLWWASNAVAEVAKRHEGDKRDELQVAAGSLLLKHV